MTERKLHHGLDSLATISSPVKLRDGVHAMIAIIQAKDRLPLLTERIVDTYAEIGGTVHLGRCPMPTYNTVVSIIEDLKSVLFPGYRRRDSLRLSNLIYHVGNLVDTLYDRLTQQVARALNYEATRRQPDSPQQHDCEDGCASEDAGFSGEAFPNFAKNSRSMPRRHTRATLRAGRWTR